MREVFEFVKRKKATVVPGYISNTRQVGETCKIYAAYALMETHTTMVEGKMPQFPARKRDRFFYWGDSLRQHAKKESLSVVGEIYNPHAFNSLFKKNGLEAEIVQKNKKDEYINYIKSCIDQGRAVIAFAPIDYNGNIYAFNPDREHGEMIVGYYTERNRLKFIYMTWGRFYTCNAETLWAATGSLDNPRIPECFYKKSRLDAFLSPHGISTPVWEVHYSLEGEGYRNATNNKNATLRNFIVTVNHRFYTEDKSKDSSFTKYKSKYTATIDDYIAYHKASRYPLFLHGSEGIADANELKRRINSFCRNLTQLKSEIQCYIEYGPGNNFPHSLKTYLKAVVESEAYKAMPKKYL